jgi:death-on-curing protein
MITIDEAIRIHNILIDKFGGSIGVRDKGLLLSALNRPFLTFDAKDLYATPIEKSSALFESLIKNHPFLDGNKRIAYVLMRLVLLQYDLDIKASEEEKYQFVIKAASGQLEYDAIKQWIDDRIIQK